MTVQPHTTRREYRAIFSDGSRGEAGPVPQVIAREAGLLHPLRFTVMQRESDGEWAEVGTGRSEREAAENLLAATLPSS